MKFGDFRRNFGQGDTNVDYSGGRRGTGRDGGLGINHFDRNGECGSTENPGRVNWQIAVPNGAYNVFVDFGESVVRTDLGGTGAGDVRCEVEHVPACLDHGVGAGNDACVFDGPVDVTDGKFSVTGYSHDTGACHSISKVTIEYIGPVGAGAGCDSPTTEAECGVAVDAAGLSRGGCGYPFTGDWGATRGCYTYPTGAVRQRCFPIELA